MAKKASKRVATRKAYRKGKKKAEARAVRGGAGGGGKKTAKKATRKSAAKKSAAVKPARKAARKPAGAKRAASLGPRPVNSGRGLTPAEIGSVVVEAFNEHRPDAELWNEYWADDVESIEGMGVSLAWHGRDAMQAKGEEWTAGHIVHSASAEGPYVGATGFAIRFRMDVEEKATGNRAVMEEVGVYSVRNGKVIREEFMYGSMTPVLVGGAAEEVVTTAHVEEAIPI
jgi:hypothetical protein